MEVCIVSGGYPVIGESLYPSHYYIVKTRIIEPCAMKSEIPFSGIGAKKTQQKHSPFPLLRQNIFFFFFLDLTERGKSDDVAHGSIIQVSTVSAQMRVQCY